MGKHFFKDEDKDEAFMLSRFGMIAVITTALGWAVLGYDTPVRSQTCYPLRVVGGQSTQIQKKVSAPGTVLVRSNWNTDFVVPSEQVFNRFVVTVVPKNGGEYKLQMSLKYNNDTADQVYNQTAKLPEGRPFNMAGPKRNNATPYQVNVSVGGLAAVGNSYTVSAVGCN
jgi:hypothetical protein